MIHCTAKKEKKKKKKDPSSTQPKTELGCYTSLFSVKKEIMKNNSHMLGNPIFLLCLASVQWLAGCLADKSWPRSVCMCSHFFSVGRKSFT